MIRMILALAALCLSFATPVPSAHAQTADAVTPALQQRAQDVLRLLLGEPIEKEVFNTNFLNAIPPDQFRAFVKQMVVQQGPAQAIEAIRATGPVSAELKIRFAKAVATVNLSIEATTPYKIAGLVVTGFETGGDTIDEVVAEINGLPGRKGLLIQRLAGDGAPLLAALDTDGRYAIASTFKLYILAELDRAVRAGERRWSDTVKLGPKAYPSGVSQTWPDDAPITLHTLATLMISISDNTATDTLIRVIGQQQLAKIVSMTGHGNPSDMQPFLMTRHAFALKMPRAAELRDRYLAGTKEIQAKLLAEEDATLSLDMFDPSFLSRKPQNIDSIEWFASPEDIVRLLDWFRTEASEEARTILAINKGISANAAAKWNYIGFKGGSEPGVMSLNFLVNGNDGQYYAISGHWNDSNALLDEGRYIALMTRLLNLLAVQ